MFCPECTGEYRRGIEVCPTCEVALVESLDAAPRRGSGRAGAGTGPRLVPSLVDLVGYVEEKEAREARRRLKEARIPSELVIRDAAPEPGSNGESAPGDEYWIRVPGTAARAAAELLHLDTSLEEDRCPSCGGSLGPDGTCQACLDRYGA